MADKDINAKRTSYEQATVAEEAYVPELRSDARNVVCPRPLWSPMSNMSTNDRFKPPNFFSWSSLLLMALPPSSPRSGPLVFFLNTAVLQTLVTYYP